MKKYRLNVDFKGREKSWCKVFEIEANSEDEAVSKMYMQLHNTMKCAFRVWSCVEQSENPKLEDKNETLLF